MTWFFYGLLPCVRNYVQTGCILRASHLWGTANIALENVKIFATFSVLLQPLWKEVPKVIGIWWNNTRKLCLLILPQPFLYFICLGCSPPHNEKTVTTLTSSYIFLITFTRFQDDSPRFRWNLSYSHWFRNCKFGKPVRSLVFLILYLHRNTNGLVYHNHIYNANLCISVNSEVFSAMLLSHRGRLSSYQ